MIRLVRDFSLVALSLGLFLPLALGESWAQDLPVSPDTLEVASPDTVTASGAEDGVSDTLRLSMSEAVGMALAQNLNMKASERAVDQAISARHEKWGALLPTISGTASYNYFLKKPVIFLPEDSFMGGGAMEIGSTNSYSAAVTAALPLLAMPLYRGIQVAKVDEAIAREDLRGARVDLRGDVETAFVGLLMAQDSYRVMEESMRSAEATLANVERLNSQGMVSEYDYIRARVQVSNLRPGFVQAGQAVETAELGLKALLNVEEAQPVLAMGSLQEIADGITLILCDTAPGLADNSTLRVLDLQQEKLGYQLKTLRGSCVPTLTAIANYQLAAQSNTFEFKNYQWVGTSMLGLQLNVPIFSGLTKIRKDQQLRIGRQQLALQREYAEMQLGVKAIMARNQMHAARESMEASEAAIDLSTRGVEIARTRYNAGSGTLLELNDAELAYTNASLNYNRAVYDYIKAYVDYRRTLGQE